MRLISEWLGYAVFASVIFVGATIFHDLLIQIIYFLHDLKGGY